MVVEYIAALTMAFSTGFFISKIYFFPHKAVKEVEALANNMKSKLERHQSELKDRDQTIYDFKLERVRLKTKEECLQKEMIKDRKNTLQQISTLTNQIKEFSNDLAQTKLKLERVN